MNKIFRIVWSEVSQAWIAVSELTKKHKKRASVTAVTAVTAVLVAGVLPSLAEASGGDSDFGPVAREDLGTDYYFRVTTANVGESDDNDHYRGCKNGNVDSECPSTEMNIGTLTTDKDPEKDTSDNSRLVLEGGNGIRLEKDADGRHKITFKAPVEAAEGSNAISIEQPIEGEKAGHTIIKSEIKSGSADKIKVDSVDGVTTITWVGGDTAGGAAGGGTSVAAGDGISVSTDNKVSVNAKNKGGLTVNGDGVSVTTDNTTITVDAATGGVKAVTGDFKVDAATGDTVANDNDGDKLTTVTNVAKAINDAKVKVEAGSGISVEHNPVSNAYTVFAPFEKTENDKGTTVTFKGKITTEHPNGETKLTGIAAGDISPTSSDAVNGAQIYGLNRGATTKVENVTVAGNTYNNVIVSNDGKNTPLLKTYNTQDKRTVLTNSVYEAIYNMNEYGIKFFHVNDGTENAKREGHSENDSSASGKYATAIGALSDASGKNAVAMGFGSTVTGDNSIAIGTGNQVEAAKSGAFGDPNITVKMLIMSLFQVAML